MQAHPTDKLIQRSVFFSDQHQIHQYMPQHVHMKTSGIEDRAFWVEMLTCITGPVLRALAARQLKGTMPVEGNGDDRFDRRHFTHLEALARSLAGIAPWLQASHVNAQEAKLQQTFAELCRRAIDAATDPQSPDYVNFQDSYQPIVDAAFLSHALLRASLELWGTLDGRVQQHLVKGLKATRTRKPHANNWLLFSAMVETALYRFGEDWDRMRVDYALKAHEQWYVGDGCYGDGPEFHWDYYNSFVIQPMLLDILFTVGHEEEEWQRLIPNALARAQRYAEIQERLISPEGTFPPIGRSLAYRCGAFQHLAQMALQHRLPDSLAPGQVRSALTAVIKRSLTAPGTFDEQGWLRVGFCGHQPDIGERYISTGSLYLCTTAFLPLGLPADDAFWRDDAQDWTAQKIWAGERAYADHALFHIAP